MKAYVAQQLKFIHHYAKYLGVDDESAAVRWISSGLAKKYAELYRSIYL